MAILNKGLENVEQKIKAQFASWGSLIILACVLGGLILMMAKFSHIY